MEQRVFINEQGQITIHNASGVILPNGETEVPIKGDYAIDEDSITNLMLLKFNGVVCKGEIFKDYGGFGNRYQENTLITSNDEIQKIIKHIECEEIIFNEKLQELSSVQRHLEDETQFLYKKKKKINAWLLAAGIANIIAAIITTLTNVVK